MACLTVFMANLRACLAGFKASLRACLELFLWHVKGLFGAIFMAY